MTEILIKNPTIKNLLENWDTATVDLSRNNRMFRFENVRLRNCELLFSESTQEYYVRFRDVTFGVFDIYDLRYEKP